MIVVFVIDTSSSMAQPAQSGGGVTGYSSLSRLDLAKMSVENLTRSMDKRILEHNRNVLMAAQQHQLQQQQQSQQHIEIGRLEKFDEFLLLSTSLQPDSNGNGSSSPSSTLDSIEACGAGGRMLVGSIEEDKSSSISENGHNMVPHPPDRHEFEYELKRLKSAKISDNK